MTGFRVPHHPFPHLQYERRIRRFPTPRYLSFVAGMIGSEQLLPQIFAEVVQDAEVFPIEWRAVQRIVKADN